MKAQTKQALRSFTFEQNRIKQRSAKFKEADISCIKAIAQAAINVELFTIPLYMTSMYSITGMHQINSKGNNFYEGRWWPGSAPSAPGSNPYASENNEKAFNLIFSVFIEEMLHLQLASNMSAMLGFTPSFTSPALQSKNYGWTCYQGTTIPHILDFKDCKGEYKDIRVQLASMNKEQIELFLAIEETETEAKDHIDPQFLPGGANPKYFEEAPFDWWQPEYGEDKLPLFGSIGHMYQSFWAYLEISYDDGSTLLGTLLKDPKVATQRDEFNRQDKGHPMKEYPGIDATINTADNIKSQFMNMINSITDQGEGRGVTYAINTRWNRPVLKTVSKQFQPDPEALEKDYPGYNDKGEQTPISGQAYSRIKAKSIDHYEVFTEVKGIIGKPGYQTWDQWHQDPANKWTAKMLNPNNTKSEYNIPSAEDIAKALNNLKQNNADENYVMLSLAAVGTIKGITTQLNEYWKTNGSIKQFPNPAMYGSGDRLSICWAITGRVPDLSLDMTPLSNDTLYHACQGMNLVGTHDPNANPNVGIFHSCKGSNDCKTQGGCGFVQNSNGGGNCSQSVATSNAGCGLPTMSAPANNKCGGHGGCAVPISASQLFPMPSEGESFVMQLFDYGPAPEFKTEPIDQISYEKGEPVYDVAWKAYCKVLEHRGQPVPNKPDADDLRLAMPPST